ncbi:MAG: purine-nucleoside phosphorylase [Bacteroidales bacterium]|nr:purine-nucleoside phosphorylase [Bacteroidales bacterium]
MNEKKPIEIFDESAEYLRSRTKYRPSTGIILGSGLGKLADAIEEPDIIPYREIPHFKASTAVGHKGNLIFGRLNGKEVVAMQGRFHYYEGYSMQDVTLPVRVMCRFGVKRLLVSNAAGGINPEFEVGDMMIITDHISFMPNPLIGKNIDELGTRFPDMTTVYSSKLRRVAIEKASSMGLTLREGVYVAETGPTYETPAEYRMYRMMGGDAVGMSTVPEVIAARHCGMEIFGMSVITNCAKDLGEECMNDGDDVVRAADKAADKMTEIFREIVNCE